MEQPCMEDGRVYAEELLRSFGARVPSTQFGARVPNALARCACTQCTRPVFVYWPTDSETIPYIIVDD